MANEFHRNQNASERTVKLNAIIDRLDGVEDRVDAIELGGVASGDGTATPIDPGDLTVYYANGKA